MKVILPACDIPLDSTVSKKTGEKTFILKDSVYIYGEGTKREIKAEDGCKFLVGEDGNINMVSGTTELCWRADPEEIREYLEELLSTDDDK